MLVRMCVRVLCCVCMHARTRVRVGVFVELTDELREHVTGATNER